MEPNESQQHHHHHLSSYFTSSTSTASTTPAPTNGLLPPHNSAPDGGGGGHHMVYPHSVGPSSAAVSTASMEPPRRKRGRPRKYGTPEQALAAKKTPPSSSNAFSREKREPASSSAPSYSTSSRKSQQFAFGNAGHGFTPHVITVAAGEDVYMKIMMFLHQSKRDICILSASGMISNASLRQPASSGGSVNFEGRFEIVSLTGSFVRTENGGRTGGLSLCLSNANGSIIGGGVVGQVIAGGPVQVILGTFQFDNKKDGGAGAKADASAGKLPSPLGGSSMSNMGFRPPGESSGRNPGRGNDDHSNIGGSFMTHPLDMHAAPSRSTDWRGGNAGYEFTGRTGHGGNHSPENGDYEQLPD